MFNLSSESSLLTKEPLQNALFYVLCTMDFVNLLRFLSNFIQGLFNIKDI